MVEQNFGKQVNGRRRIRQKVLVEDFNIPNYLLPTSL